MNHAKSSIVSKPCSSVVVFTLMSLLGVSGQAWAVDTLLRGGDSIGPGQALQAGTLGMVVFDKKTGAPKILSAAHVFSGGRDPNAVLSAGFQVYNAAAMPIGKVDNWKFLGPPIDFATAVIDGPISPKAGTINYNHYNGEIQGIGPIRFVQRTPTIGRRVKYWDRLKRAVHFCKIVEILPNLHMLRLKGEGGSGGCAIEGNSGSVIVDEFSFEAVGMIISIGTGSPNSDTNAILMTFVMDTLEVELYNPIGQTRGLFHYFHARDRSHLYTIEWSELGPGLDGWTFTGTVGNVGGVEYNAEHLGLKMVPLDRYNAIKFNDHLYTTNHAELGQGNNDYKYEGAQQFLFPGPATGRLPLYRYRYSSGTGGNTLRHYLTLVQNDTFVQTNHATLEGIIGYVNHPTIH